MTPERAERRVFPRVPLATKVEVVAEGRSFLAVVGNVSAGGMLIHTANPAPSGSRLELSFTLPDRAQPIRAQALVRHVVAGSSMGVQFEGLAPQEADAIREYTRKAAL